MEIDVFDVGMLPLNVPSRASSYTQLFGELFRYTTSSVTLNRWTPDSIELYPRGRIVDAILITGSPASAHDDLPWMKNLEKVLEAAVFWKVPVVGICFGHQFVAKWLGGRVELNKAGWGLGVQRYSLRKEALPWLDCDKDNLNICTSHQEHVVELPREATVFAFSEHAPIAGAYYRFSPMLTLQGHPEIDASFMDSLISHLGIRGVNPSKLTDARKSLCVPIDQEAWSRLLVSFVHEGA
ncbi:MAG: type 1 glutamine amidotransferase [Pseudomonadota bacterium]